MALLFGEREVIFSNIVNEVLEYHSFKKISYVFKEIAKALFECAVLDEKYWIKRPRLFRCPDVFYGAEKGVLPEYPLNVWEIISSFRKGFEYYSELYKMLLPDKLWAYLNEKSKMSLDDFEFESKYFAEGVLRLFLAYRFGDFVQKEDLKEALCVLYMGRLAAFIKEMEHIKGAFGDLEYFDFEDRILDLSYSSKRRSREDYLKFTEEFFALWNDYRCGKSVCELPQVESLEYIAGIPVVISKEIPKRDGTKIYTGPIFKELVDTYKNRFYSFIERIFDGKKLTTKEEYLKDFNDILLSLNEKIDKVFPGELSKKEDVEAFLKSLYKYAGPQKVMALTRDFVEKVIYSFPPENTLLRMGTTFVKEMLSQGNPHLLFTYVMYGEDEGYLERLMSWMKDGLRIEVLEDREMNIFVYDADVPHNVGLVEPITYEPFSGSIVVSVLPKGTGGSYPKLYYFLNFLKALAEAEIYREMWTLYKEEKKEFGRRVVNSCNRYSSWEAFSVKSVLENLKHQRVFEILGRLSQRFLEEGMDLGFLLKKVMEGYFIGFNLKEGIFFPCSVYTWADYSFRGGKGIPTPFSVRVERDGFNTSLVIKLLKESGYGEDVLKYGVYDLIGRSGHDIDVLSEFLYIEEHKGILLRQEAALWPAAGVLVRYDGNPILKPIPEHYWESKYVLNCASVHIDGRVYLLYRAFGEDEVSRIGLAVLRDGLEVAERLDYPIFSPSEAYEKKGCEDPRVVLLDGELFMFYTAYDGITAQIAAASIKVDNFLKKEFSWKRKGPVFPNIWNKDATLFPEKIGGKFYMLHRLEPSIWISCSEDLTFPWNDKEQKILISPRPGLWDSLKVGAGAQPIKTKYGWLIIYHGVDDMLVYRLGVLLLDLENPEIILYRSPNSVLWPEALYEVGDKKSWVKNVVFTCGAVNLEGKELLEDEDEIVVYYGASDTYICAAKCRISELLPDAVRKL